MQCVVLLSSSHGLRPPSNRIPFAVQSDCVRRPIGLRSPSNRIKRIPAATFNNGLIGLIGLLLERFNNGLIGLNGFVGSVNGSVMLTTDLTD